MWFQADECLIKIMSVLGHQSLAKCQKMLKKFINLSTETTAKQSTSSLSSTAGISYGFCQDILGENLIMHSVAARFVPWLLTFHQKQCLDMCLVFHDMANANQAFTFRIWLQSRDKTTIVVEEPMVTKTKEHAADPECNKKYAHCFFFPTSGTSLTENLCLPAVHWILTFTVMFWGAWQKIFDKKDYNCGTTTSDCCIIKMRPLTPPSTLSSFLQKSPRQSSVTPPCSPRMKLKMKGCCFDTVDEKQMELQTVLHCLQKKDFYSVPGVWKRCKRTFQRGWWPNLNKVSLYFFKAWSKTYDTTP